MKNEKTKVLYIDDEPNNLVSFKASFRIKYDVTTCLSAAEALDVLEKEKVQVIVTDQRMPNMTGVEFLESILDTHPEPVRILLTGYADINAVIDAVNKGKIYKYLSKPWNEQELDKTMEEAAAIYAENQQEETYKKSLEVSNDQLEFLLRQKLLS